MTNIFKNAAITRMAAAAVVATGLLTASAAQAMDRGVYVYNVGSDPIYSVYLSKVNYRDGWGPDLLGDYMIDVDQQYQVEPYRPYGYCRFDIKIIYETGEEVILGDVNICGGRQMVVADEWEADVYTI